MKFEVHKVIYDVTDERVKDLIGKKVVLGTNLYSLSKDVEQESDAFVDVLKGIDKTHGYFMFDNGRMANLIYPADNPTTYRPFESPEEMIDIFRFRVCEVDGYNPVVDGYSPSVSLPIIWLKYKDSNTRQMVTAFADTGIEMGSTYMSWGAAFKDMVFLDNTPCGVKIN